MKCQNCGKKMKHKKGIGHAIDFSGTAEDWELEYFWETYKCKACKIKYDGRNWKIPDALLPTEKQKNTISFINNHLDMDLSALTKKQCWSDINKYFEKAKKRPLHSDEYYMDLQEEYGMCESDFC